MANSEREPNPSIWKFWQWSNRRWSTSEVIALIAAGVGIAIIA